jgi:hypothetical protein
MEALNALYAVQLQNTTSQVEVQNSVMEKLGASMASSENLSDEVTKLANNLGQLNGVYGNMLAAMGGNRS